MHEIYMDYQSTTPCDQRVIDAMLPYFNCEFGNPHSVSHEMGHRAHDAVEIARSQVADLIHANDSREIIFTSGATEANNLAIQGIARFYKSRGNKIIVSAVEHKCVLESARAMTKEGFEIIVVPVDRNGVVNVDFLENAMDNNVVLTSIMTVSNEIGTIQPIKKISEICRRHNVIFHTDAAQAVGKIDIDARDVDLMSISGHKIYGPKGIGALYINLKYRVQPILFGGGQERGMRSGTLAAPLCVGLGTACQIAKEEMVEENKRLTEFKNYFIEQMLKMDKVYLNGDKDNRIPGCLNFSFDGIEGEGIMLGMPEVCISSGSACTSATLEPSYVLKAISVKKNSYQNHLLQLGYAYALFHFPNQLIFLHLTLSVHPVQHQQNQPNEAAIDKQGFQQ